MTTDADKRNRIKAGATVAALAIAGVLVGYDYLTGAQWMEFAVRLFAQITP